MDNFLKRKQWKTSHAAINSNESAIRYFRAVDKVKYYDHTDHADESESDNLLSLDEEPDTRYRRLDSMRSMDIEEQNLLGPTRTWAVIQRIVSCPLGTKIHKMLKTEKAFWKSMKTENEA